MSSSQSDDVDGSQQIFKDPGRVLDLRTLWIDTKHWVDCIRAKTSDAQQTLCDLQIDDHELSRWYHGVDISHELTTNLRRRIKVILDANPSYRPQAATHAPAAATHAPAAATHAPAAAQPAAAKPPRTKKAMRAAAKKETVMVNQSQLHRMTPVYKMLGIQEMIQPRRMASGSGTIGLTEMENGTLIITRRALLVAVMCTWKLSVLVPLRLKLIEASVNSKVDRALLAHAFEALGWWSVSECAEDPFSDGRYKWVERAEPDPTTEVCSLAWGPREIVD